MSKEVHVHIHDGKQAKDSVAANGAQSVIRKLNSILSELRSADNSAEKDDPQTYNRRNEDCFVNARYNIEQAIKELNKVQ